MADDIHRIIMQVENAAEVARLTELVRAQTADLQANIAAHGNAAAATRASAAALQQSITQLNASASATRNWGRATLEASRGLEDLQYGVGGVLNNIPSLVQALGGSAGIAGALSAAAVGAKVLYDHWDELAQVFGGGHTKTQAEEMEALAKQTSKTADETERLAKWEEKRKTVAAQSGDKTKAEAEAKKAAHDAIVEGPYSTVRQAVEKIDGQAFRNAAPQELVDEKKKADDKVKEYAERERTGDFGDSRIEFREMQEEARKEQEAAQKKLDDDYNNKVAGKVADLELDPKNMQSFLDKIEKDHSLLGGTGNTRKFQEATKTSSDKDSEAADAHAAKVEADHQSRLAKNAEAARLAKDKEVDEAVKEAGKDAEDYDKEQGQNWQKKASRFAAAATQDAIERQKPQDPRIVDGAASLRDSIQASARQKDPTAQAQLDTQLRIEAGINKLIQKDPGMITALAG